jgi:hypothetical protein
MTPGCESPLPIAILEGYWFGELPAPEAERVEEHFLACDECGARLRALAALGEGVRRLAGEGAVPLVVGPSFLEAASRAGLRTREYSVPPGGRVACTVTPQDDLLVGRMRADFRGVSRLDVLVEMAGLPGQRIEDVPVSPDANELILLQAMPAARALGRAELRIRLVARDGGLERVLGDYTFDHTPTPH